MENNTKIAIGLAAAVVVGYIVYKSSKPKTQTQTGSTSKCKGEFAVECNDGSCDIGNGIVRPCLGKGGQKGTTPEPNCICKQYPCNCGESDGYGYMPSKVTTGSGFAAGFEEEIERLEADRRNIGNWDLSKPQPESRPYTQEEEEKMMRIIQNTNPNSYAGY